MFKNVFKPINTKLYFGEMVLCADRENLLGGKKFNHSSGALWAKFTKGIKISTKKNYPNIILF